MTDLTGWGSTGGSHQSASELARFVYWLVVGAALGVGVIGILSIGLPFLVAGLILLLVGSRTVGFRGAAGILIGSGSLPAVLLLRAILTAPPPCTAAIQPGQECGAVPATYTTMAVLFAGLAVLGLLAPMVRGRGRLELPAAVASGMATLAWSIEQVVSPVPYGQTCSGSSGAGELCAVLMSRSLWSQGNHAAITAILIPGVVAALLVMGLAYVHWRFSPPYALRVLWLVAAVLLFRGLLSADFLAALPGMLAVVSALAGGGARTPWQRAVAF